MCHSDCWLVILRTFQWTTASKHSNLHFICKEKLSKIFRREKIILLFPSTPGSSHQCVNQSIVSWTRIIVMEQNGLPSSSHRTPTHRSGRYQAPIHGRSSARTPGTPGRSRTPGTPVTSRTPSSGGRTPNTPNTPSGQRRNGRVSLTSLGSSTDKPDKQSQASPAATHNTRYRWW